MDKTDKKDTEMNIQQLVESERMLNDLMGNLPGLVYRCYNDKAWTMIFLNENCFELTGYPIDDLLNNKVVSYLDLIHPDDSKNVWNEVQKAINNNARFDITYRIFTADSKQKWVREKGKGILDESGKLLFIEGFIFDVTEIKKSEVRYRESIEFAVDGILIGDLKGYILDANTSIQKLAGLSLEEMRGKHVSEFFHKEELELKPLRFDIIQNGKTVINERYIERPDGSLVPVEMHSKLMPNNTLQAIVRDISERKKADQLIVESEEKFRRLAETSAVSIMIFQHDKWVYSNPAGEMMSGYSLHELVKMKFWDFVHPDDLRLVKLLGLKVQQGKGKYTSFNFRIINKKGDVRWVYLQGNAIIYRGKPAGILSILDMTEQKNAEISLKENVNKYRNLFNKSKDPTLVIDGNKFIDCNKAAVEILGYSTKKDIFNTHPSKLSPKYQSDGKLSFDKANEMMKKALSKGYHRFEWEHVTQDGQVFPVDVALTKIPVNGKDMLYTVWRDISERKLSEKRQQALYNISNAVISSQSLEEVYELIVSELAKLINIKNFFIALYDESKDLITVPFMRDKKDEFKNLPKKTLTAHVLKTRKSLLVTRSQMDEMARRKEINQLGAKAKVWLGVPLMSKGKAIGVVVIQDYENVDAIQQSDQELLEFVSYQIGMTIERKLFEDELKRAFHKASESDRLKSSFLATMSHELRTPLNAIIGFSELIADGINIKDAVTFAQTINNSGNHLLAIVEDIFDITLIETGESKIHKTEFLLHKTLEDIHQILLAEQALIEDNDAELIINLPPKNRNLKVFMDRQKFNQISINLLKNALKFTPQGSVEFGYIEREEEGKAYLEFFVKDTGIGIQEDMQGFIFDMFRQVDESYTREYGGVGIGLSLTKKLTELLGGQIWLESELGKGSTFYFTMVDCFSPEGDTARETYAEFNLEKLNNKEILVVEDVESSFFLLEALLKKFKVKLLWAKNGIEAIEMVRGNSMIELILMDVNMPIMNGFEATAEIKKIRPTLPVIAQTAYANSGDREMAISAGFNEYLEKPIRKNLLYKMLDELL